MKHTDYEYAAYIKNTPISTPAIVNSELPLIPFDRLPLSLVPKPPAADAEGVGTAALADPADADSDTVLPVAVALEGGSVQLAHVTRKIANLEFLKRLRAC